MGGAGRRGPEPGSVLGLLTLTGFLGGKYAVEPLLADCAVRGLEPVTHTDLATAVRMNTLVLRHTERFFGTRATLHVWLTWHDYRNASLMILLSYILLGHPDWQEAELSIWRWYGQMRPWRPPEYSRNRRRRPPP